jgi:tetratricopeptide (TPR) repeat protein
MRIPNILFVATILAALAWPNAALPADPPADKPEAAAASPAPEKTKPAPEVKPEKPEAKSEKPDAKPEKPEAKQPDAEQFFTQGREALFQGKYTEAVDLLEKAVAADKSKTSYRLSLARAYRYAKKNEQAISNLEAILKIAPDHVEAGQMLGELYSAAKQWKDVVRVLEPLLKYRHDYPTYHMLAEAQNNLDDRDKARKSYEEAIKLNADSASDHYQLGNIYLAGNLFAMAAESYQSALRLGLDSPVLRYKLGSAFFNLRNYFGNISVQTIRSGAAGTINGPWYLIELVPGQKDVFRCAPENSAIYQIAKAMADGIEDRPDIHVLRATIYLNARRYGQAYEMFTEILPKVKDDKALFHYYYAQAAFGTGQYDRYLELLEDAIKLDPAAYKSARVDAYLAVADQYNQAGDLEKYIDYLVKAVAESPQTASLHLKLGYAYEEARKFDQAIGQWRMVLDLEPDHPQRMKLLNLVEKYTGSEKRTVQTAEKPKPEKPKAKEKPEAPRPKK